MNSNRKRCLSEGNLVRSDDLLKGPLVISFYRGVWCPCCNMELQALEAAKPESDKLGTSLVAISPQTAPNSRKSVRQNNLTFPILSDVNGEVAAAFGIRFKLPDYLIDLYKSLKNDLPAFNNDPSWALPMPARYAIAQDGTIAYAEVNPAIPAGRSRTTCCRPCVNWCARPPEESGRFGVSALWPSATILPSSSTMPFLNCAACSVSSAWPMSTSSASRASPRDEMRSPTHSPRRPPRAMPLWLWLQTREVAAAA